MKSGKNRVKLVDKQQPVTIGNTIVHSGDIIYGDDSGVIAIPNHLFDTVLIKATEISKMEIDLLSDINNVI